MIDECRDFKTQYDEYEEDYKNGYSMQIQDFDEYMHARFHPYYECQEMLDQRYNKLIWECRGLFTETKETKIERQNQEINDSSNVPLVEDMYETKDDHDYDDGYDINISDSDSDDSQNPYSEWYDYYDETGHHTPYYDEMREDTERENRLKFEAEAEAGIEIETYYSSAAAA